MKRKAVLFYQYKKIANSNCLDCDAPTNLILELADGSDFRCCENCARKIYHYHKEPKKCIPKSRKAIFRQKSRVKKQLEPLIIPKSAEVAIK